MFAEKLHLVFTCSVVLIRKKSRKSTDLHARRKMERQQKQVSVKEVAQKGLEWKNAGFPSTLM